MREENWEAVTKMREQPSEERSEAEQLEFKRIPISIEIKLNFKERWSWFSSEPNNEDSVCS